MGFVLRFFVGYTLCMFALRTTHDGVAVYAEWAVFTVLLFPLVALWWFLAIDRPGETSPLFEAQVGTVPQKVIDTLLAGGTAKVAISDVVLAHLSRTIAENGAGTAHSPGSGSAARNLPTADSAPIPQDVVKILSAH